jgi:hypothetical protein
LDEITTGFDEAAERAHVRAFVAQRLELLRVAP